MTICSFKNDMLPYNKSYICTHKSITKAIPVRIEQLAGLYRKMAGRVNGIPQPISQPISINRLLLLFEIGCFCCLCCLKSVAFVAWNRFEIGLAFFGCNVEKNETIFGNRLWNGVGSCRWCWNDLAWTSLNRFIIKMVTDCNWLLLLVTVWCNIQWHNGGIFCNHL